MKFWVGITDNEWFEYLAARRPDEVNFWRPSRAAFRVIEPGAPFLFKLHSPLNYIAGGGFFVTYSRQPLSRAWEAFGEKNGVPTREALHASILRYRARGVSAEPDPEIGCIVLASPFFFEREDWIPAPEVWSPTLVQGRSFDTNDPAGRAVWENVQARLMARRVATREAAVQVVENAGYGKEYLTRARLGQGAFRVLVTDAYGRRCAITGERTLPALQASHIKPFGQSGPNLVRNGLLLRADLHLLFDSGFITVTPEYRVAVSRRIREEYENGRDYYAFADRELAVLPREFDQRPSADFIRWHNDNVFRP